MGLETAALVMASVEGAPLVFSAIAGGAMVGKSILEIQAANEKEKALDLQAKQLQLQNQQKTLSNYAVMEKVIDAQVAHMTTTGTAFSSPSFNAIQRDTLNIGAKKQRNLEIEGELEQENIKIEKQNVRNTLYAQLFGNIAQSASSAINIYTKTPRLQE